MKPLTPPDAIEVKRLYVRPAFRRNGVGRLLVGHAHQHADENGFGRLILDFLPSRANAIDFYRQLGYAEFSHLATESSNDLIDMQRAVK